MDSNIYQIEQSIKHQIEVKTQQYYKDLQSKARHADGSCMYNVDQHIIDGLQIALSIVSRYE